MEYASHINKQERLHFLLTLHIEAGNPTTTTALKPAPNDAFRRPQERTNSCKAKPCTARKGLSRLNPSPTRGRLFLGLASCMDARGS